MIANIREIKNNATELRFTNGVTLSLESPLIMGIINITPDSFYDGGRYLLYDAAIERSEKLIAEGADMLDLGAASTRPGAEEVTPDEELKRLLPVLEYLVKNHPGFPVSIDTFHASVAKETLEKGASLINDISGGADPAMYPIVAEYKVPYVLMHIQGTPKTMQQNPHYEDIVSEVFEYFNERIKKLRIGGVSQIIIDPGFGFGKTVEHNYTLLQHIHKFKNLGLPVMAGVSRKSMINKVLKTKPENALAGTVSLNTLALLQGADILRVHDVKEARQVILLVKQYLTSNSLAE